MQDFNNKGQITIEGTVEEIVYANENTGFAVIEMECENQLVCVVGPLAGVQAGEDLKATGSYVTHHVYGMQFKAEMVERILPTTTSAIKKYLASGVIKGIGKTFAVRIVDHFGEQTLEVLENYPERLVEVKGISPSKSEKLAEEFKQIFGVRKLVVFLERFGIPSTKSVDVWKKWGNMSIELISSNPYCLCCSDVNISFNKADEIAQNFDVPKNSFNRVKTGIC